MEFALFSIFLVLIVSGIVDLGRGLYTAIALNDAVQEGAMFAAFTDDIAGIDLTAADIEARVVASTSSPQLSGDDVTVSCVAQVRAKQSGSRVTVELVHSVDLMAPFISDWFDGSMTIHREAVVDRFFSDCPAGSTS